MNQNNSVKENILTVILTVLVFVGIQFLQIPLPSPSGKLFLHCAHIFIAVALVSMDYVRVMIAGIIGLAAYHVLHGEFSAIMGDVFSTIVSCLAAGTVCNLWMDQDSMTVKDECRVGVKAIFLYGALLLLSTLAWRSWSAMMSGTKIAAAALSVLGSALPMAIQTVFTVIGALVLFFPVHIVCKRILKG